MKTAILLTAAIACLALISSASGTTASGRKVMHLNAPVEALAMSGKNIAYDLEGTYPLPNRLFVWNVYSGTTTKVSGSKTAHADGTAEGGVNRLAIAGTQVAWRITSGGNSETDEDIYSSSARNPKERHVAGTVRYGDQCGAGQGGPTPACAGTWLGGVVASGKNILVNRWTTDTTGSITGGGLYTLDGTTLKPFVTGGTAVEAVAADAARIAVLQWVWYDPDTTVNVYSSAGALLTTVTPAAVPKRIALSGRNLLVLEAHGKLAWYDAQTGVLKNTFTLHSGWEGGGLAVQGGIAVYSTAADRPKNGVRALNLSTGKDVRVGLLPGRIEQLAMDSAGVAYANYAWTGTRYDTELVFRPLATVVAAVQ